MKDVGSQSATVSEPGYFALPALASYLAMFGQAAGFVALPPALVPLMERLHIETSVAGTLFLAMFFGYALASILGGILADRFGRCLIITAGMGGMALGLACIGIVPALAWALVCMLVVGLGVGAVDGGVNALMIELFPRRHDSAIMIDQAFFSVGALLTPIGIGLALSLGVSWRLVFLGPAAICALVTVLFALATRGLPVGHRATGLRDDGADRRPLALLHHPVFRLLAVAIFLYIAGEATLASWLPAYLERLEAPTLWASGALSAFWGAMAIGRAGTAWLARHVQPLRLLTMSAAVGAAAMLAVGLARDYQLAFAAAMVAGLAVSGIWGLLVASASRLFPSQLGTAAGAMAATGALGGVVFPPAIGVVARFIGLGPGLVVSSLPILAVAVLTANVGRREREKGKREVETME